MMHPPAISVVMPVYNRRATVLRAVQSVVSQSFPRCEIIVADDGSTDDTVATIQSLRDPRIRVLRSDRNRGANAARNSAIRSSLAEIVCFIDSDDEYLPGKLEHIFHHFGRHASVDVLIDSYELIDARRPFRAPVIRRNPVLLTSHEVEEAVFARRVYKATPSISARRTKLLEAGLFDETLTRRQDMDMILRLVRCSRCATTDAVLWRKHWSSDAISAQQKTFMRAMIDICERHPRYLEVSAFRAGLSRDFVRHFLRLAWQGQGLAILADASDFARFKGRMETLHLFREGCIEIAQRALGQRQSRQAAEDALPEADKPTGSSSIDLPQAL